MADFLLSDVNVVAVSICKGPANRKRIFLKKHEGDPDALIQLHHSPLIKVGDDWRVFYTVVAEPGAEEQPGVGAGAVPGTTDAWASEEEIVKASHGFMRAGGLINLQHRDLNAVGRVVENFICPTDFTSVDPLGAEQTIKKGSWVIGIEPDDNMRALIDAGELDGVSYEGTGMRTAVAKGHDNDSPATHSKCPKCGGKKKRGQTTCQNCGGKQHVHKAGHPVAPPAPTNPVKNLVQHYMTKKHPFTACVRDNTKRFGPDKAQRVCAKLKDMGKGTTGWRGKDMKKMDELPDEFYTACEENWSAAGLTDADAIVALEDALANEDRTILEKIAASLGIKTDEDDLTDETHEEDDVPLTDQEKASLAKVEGIETKQGELETKVDGLGSKIDTLLARLPEREKSPEEEREELQKSVETLTENLTEVSGRLDKLAEGETRQGSGPDNLKKNDDPDAALANALFG